MTAAEHPELHARLARISEALADGEYQFAALLVADLEHDVALHDLHRREEPPA